MKACLIFAYLCLVSVHEASAFFTNFGSVPSRIGIRRHPTERHSQSLPEAVESTTADKVLTEMHSSGFPFRIVVVGNGAILETTSILGPTMKSSVSPKTGERLVTLASQDQSFEFHVKVEQVEDVIFAETKRPIENGEKVLRICRLMNGEGTSICSLILNDDSDKAVQWFSDMKDRF